MDILRDSIDWAKSELISTPFFAFAGLVFIAMSIGCWQMGKTELAKSYIIPTLVAGVLLVLIGLGLFFTNKARITQFESAYQENPIAFIDSELERTQSTLKEYKNVVFTGIPIIIVLCATVLYFTKGPLVRASMITTIAMMSIILLIDGLAHARIGEYEEILRRAKEEITK